MKRTNTDSLSRVRDPLLLLGAGKMGQAMLDGWLAQGLEPRKVVVLEPKPSSDLQKLVERGVVLNPAKAVPAEAIVMAVKPQTAAEALPLLKSWVAESTLALSIMAGRTI